MVSTTLKKLTVLLVLLLQTTWGSAQEMAIFRPKFEGTERMIPGKMIAQVSNGIGDKVYIKQPDNSISVTDRDSVYLFQEKDVTSVKDMVKKKYRLYAQKSSNFQNGEITFCLNGDSILMHFTWDEKTGQKHALYGIHFSQNRSISTHCVFSGTLEEVQKTPKTGWSKSNLTFSHISGDIQGFYNEYFVFVEDTTGTDVPTDRAEHTFASLCMTDNAMLEQMVTAQTETNPEFPGGVYACMDFLSRHIKYPSVCIKKGIQGRVYVQFIVSQDGSVENIEILRSPDPLLSEEAIRVISKMPKWKPGTIGGKPVRVKFSLPVSFKLTNNDNKGN